MKRVECPTCGAPIDVHNPASVWLVCSYCASVVVDHGTAPRADGTMARLIEDPSPLQIGTDGTIDGAAFTLIGRLRLTWERGWWNEWCCMFADGRTGWLAEWAGQYAMSFVTEGAQVPESGWFDAVESGQRIQVGKRRYLVHDIKDVECTASEGELPFRAPIGRKTRSVDISGRRRMFGTLERSDEGVALYEGEYQSFDDMKLQMLREIEGWKP